MFDHRIRRGHCLEVHQGVGEVDGLDMAATGELVLFVASVEIWPPKIEGFSAPRIGMGFVFNTYMLIGGGSPAAAPAEPYSYSGGYAIYWDMQSFRCPHKNRKVKRKKKLTRRVLVYQYI